MTGNGAKPLQLNTHTIAKGALKVLAWLSIDASHTLMRL
jgi:hypothetical protein